MNTLYTVFGIPKQYNTGPNLGSSPINISPDLAKRVSSAPQVGNSGLTCA